MLVLLICVLPLMSIAQSSKSAMSPSTSSSSQVIVFNYKTKLITSPTTVIPFDRRFYFQIDSIPTNDIMKITVYSVKYEHGLRLITDSVKLLRAEKVFRPSFYFKDWEYTTGNNVLTLHFPALRPNRDFDILITKKFSSVNVQKALALNASIDKYAKDETDQAVLQNTQPPGADSLGKQFYELARTVNNPQYSVPKPVSFLTLQSPNKVIDSIYKYKSALYDPLRPIYDTITGRKQGKFRYDNFFNQPAVTTLTQGLTKDDAVYARLYLLQKIFNDIRQHPKQNYLKDIQNGLITVDYNLQTKSADIYDFNKRLRNLGTTYRFLDSLYAGVLGMQSRQRVSNGLVDSTAALRDGILINQAYLAQLSKEITKRISNTQEGIWVVGQNTVAQDFQTLGSRIFTVNAGLANIWAYDRSGSVKPLVKLSIGFDFYFRSIDKNVDFKYLKRPGEPDSTYNHYLESRRQNRFALSVGATLGSMGNKDFDNVYGNFSFTFGGSYVLLKGLKVTGGLALIKRYDNNPLLASQKSLIAAPYLGLMADYDLIGVISSFTSQLFK